MIESPYPLPIRCQTLAMDNPEERYRLRFEERPGYLYACIDGISDSLDISRSYWQAVADEVQARDAEAVLIEENIPVNGTFADVFQLATEIPTMGFGRCKVAFFDRYLEQHEINAFGELVATNRGLNGRVFNSYDDALEWLLGEEN